MRNELPQVLSVLKTARIDGRVVTLAERLLNAAETGDIKEVRNSIELGANVNTRDYRRATKNCTPLMLATAKGYLEIVDALLAANGNPNLSDDDGKSIPGLISGNEETIKNMGYTLDRTPLMLAASYGHINILQKLIAAGAKIDRPDKLGETALFLACFAGNIEIAQVLLEFGANIHLRNTAGETVLFPPAAKCDLALIELLIDNDVEVNVISNNSEIVLAAVAGSTQKVLVKESDRQLGDREYTNKGIFETRPFPEDRVLAAVKMLVAAGAEINLPNLYTTPIAAAACQGHLQVIQYL